MCDWWCCQVLFHEVYCLPWEYVCYRPYLFGSKAFHLCNLLGYCLWCTAHSGVMLIKKIKLFFFSNTFTGRFSELGEDFGFNCISPTNSNVCVCVHTCSYAHFGKYQGQNWGCFYSWHLNMKWVSTPVPSKIHI